MLASLKSEFRKLVTVRSTYFILAIAVAITGLASLVIGGLYATPEQAANPLKLQSEIVGAAVGVAFLTGLIAILLFTHEYRYNTIMYTLTASKSRSRSLLAKFLVVSALAVVTTIAFGTLAFVFTKIGLAIKGIELVPQTTHWRDIVWQCLFSAWAYVTYAFIIAGLIRNQIGALVVFLIAPTTIESLLTLLLKDNVKYLPFTAMGRITTDYTFSGLMIVLTYMIVGLAVTWFLFVRRDAN